MRVAAALALWACAAAAAAQAPTRRFAVVAASNRGWATDVQLQYSESDADRITQVLSRVGGFEPEDIVALRAEQALELPKTLRKLNERIRATPGPTVLFVFYSGHADQDALHIHGEGLALEEVRSLVVGSPAQVRLLVLDACHSGAATRVKGGKPGPSFEVRPEEQLGEGLLMLTSSAAHEVAQESDELGASFFTHYLVSALVGAGDRDGSGTVTVSEAFSYASEKTTAATASTQAGPQHPTFRTDFGGRGDLVLTTPGVLSRGMGRLELPEAGWYVVQKGDSGQVIADVRSDAATRLALEAGIYKVSRRERRVLLMGDVQVAAGGTTRVDLKQLARYEYVNALYKGGTEIASQLSLFAAGGVRSSLIHLGWAPGGQLGVRLDVRRFGIELKAHLASARSPTGIASWEVLGSLAGLVAFNLKPVVLGVGLTAGLGWWGLRYSDGRTPAGNSLVGMAGGVGLLQLTVGRLYVRLDAGVGFYVVPRETDERSRYTDFPLWWQVGLGPGVYF